MSDDESQFVSTDDAAALGLQLIRMVDALKDANPALGDPVAKSGFCVDGIHYEMRVRRDQPAKTPEGETLQ